MFPCRIIKFVASLDQAITGSGTVVAAVTARAT